MLLRSAKFTDSINLISRLTPLRLYNALIILFTYYYSIFIGKPFQKGMPVSISFEPTTSCNLRCPECPSGLRSFTRPTGMLEESLFKKTIDEIASTLLFLTFYFQGEPYLHPQFLSLIKYASDKNIYTSTSTNAHYLNDKNARETVESGLDRLIISIDGTTQDTYQSYRQGGQLNKVIEGTKNIIKWKQKLNSKTPYLIFQFLVVKPNEHQIDDVKKLANELGVDEVKLKTAQIYDFENGSDLMPTISKYSRYKLETDGKYKLKNELHNNCWKMWHSCVITWNGLVVPCCFDKDAEYQMGDVKKFTFKEIWNNKTYKTFRQTLLRNRGKIEMCKNCTEGAKVWA